MFATSCSFIFQFTGLISVVAMASQRFGYYAECKGIKFFFIVSLEINRIVRHHIRVGRNAFDILKPNGSNLVRFSAFWERSIC